MPGSTDQAMYSWSTAPRRLSEQSHPMTSHCCLTHTLAKLGLYLFGFQFQSLHVCWTVFLPAVPCWYWGCAAAIVGLGGACSAGGVRALSWHLSSKTQVLSGFLLAWHVMWSSQCELSPKSVWQEIFSNICATVAGTLLLNSRDPLPIPCCPYGTEALLYTSPLTASILNFFSETSFFMAIMNQHFFSGPLH